MATTATPGDAWEDEPKLDYFNIPTDEFLGMDLDDDSPTCLAEIERAKRHWKFNEFLTWYFKRYEGEIDESYEWGRADGDPIEDLKDFFTWLVEIGEGQWQGWTSPEGPSITSLGTIPFSKNWEKELYALTMGYNPKDIWVDAKGWILDFMTDGKLKLTPAKSQFPLEVRYLASSDVESETKETEEKETMEEKEMEEDVSVQESLLECDTWANNAGWDLWAEYEACNSQGEDDKHAMLSGHHEEPAFDFENDLLEEFTNSPLNEVNQKKL